jgi:hypothetical protein
MHFGGVDPSLSMLSLLKFSYPVVHRDDYEFLRLIEHHLDPNARIVVLVVTVDVKFQLPAIANHLLSTLLEGYRHMF